MEAKVNTPVIKHHTSVYTGNELRTLYKIVITFLNFWKSDLDRYPPCMSAYFFSIFSKINGKTVIPLQMRIYKFSF
jgi:hypothetical protein